MSADEPSLSDHEQRILAEIERNLKAEDPDFVRQVSEARPTKDAGRLLRVSVLCLLLGVGALVFYFQSIAFGIVGFLLMLASVVGIVTGIRRTSSGGASGTMFGDFFRRAEERMRSRRPPEQ
jgi:hypothetical protein